MADNTVAITAGSGTLVRTVTNAGVDSGAHQQVFTPADAFGNLNPADPDGTQNVSDDPSSLLLDSFDTTMANFTVGGTAGTIANSTYTFTSNTTASTANYFRSTGAFLLRAGAYLKQAAYMRFEAAAVTNATRWWGIGTNQGSPTAAAPVLNGAVFQLDYADGALYAMTYNNGTQTKIATLTRPTDALQHKYDVWYRQSVIYWLIDGVVVATKTLPSLNVWQSPYLLAGQINHTTAPSTAPTLVALSVSVADTGNNSQILSDGTNPYLQATVKAASTAAAATDTALVVGLHPTSPLPAGTNALGSVTLGAGTITNALGRVALFDGTNDAAVKAASTASVGTDTSLVVALGPNSPIPTGSNRIGYPATGVGVLLASAASQNPTVVKAAAGTLYSLAWSNTTATVMYLKLYNATALTMGTTVAGYVLTLTANSSGTLNLGAVGQYFATGISLSIGGAAGTTDNATAAVVGAYLAYTYF